MEHIDEISKRIVDSTIQNTEFRSRINKIASRHIGRLIKRMEQRYRMNDDAREMIKAQFRMMQDDVIKAKQELD